ncbi:hypothetical protein A5661_16105 [Mycobacterium asiaticum]|nr:hypothetical protein A5661_16105 [Mycobacterium asiaticum]
MASEQIIIFSARTRSPLMWLGAFGIITGAGTGGAGREAGPGSLIFPGAGSANVVVGVGAI